MAELIRASALKGYDALVRELGGDPDALLRRVGIDPSLAGDVDAFIGFRELVSAHELAASELDAPTFCLQLSERQGLEILGPVAMIGRHSRTVGDALDGIAQFMHVYSPAIQIEWGAEGDIGEYLFSIPDRVRDRLPGVAQIAEATLGATLQIARLLLGESFSPLSVSFQHTPGAPLEVYERHFGCPVRVGAPAWGATFPLSVLGRPIHQADPEVRFLITRYLEELGAAVSGADLPAEIGATLKRLLPTGHFDLAAVADQLVLHPRTLQRRLAEARTTFEDVLDRTRRELAEQYLRDTDMPLYQLARLLGYASPGSLSRASLRWFGRSPRAVRNGR